MTHHIAVYGKSGVGKSTLAANVSAALIEAGFSVMFVGCDPGGDSCFLLHGGSPISTVSGQIRNHTALTPETILHEGFKGIRYVELVGGTCFSADLSHALQELHRSQMLEQIHPDYVLYDVSGDNSCATLRTVLTQGDIIRVFVATTADFKALQAVNDVFSFLEQYNSEHEVPIPMGGLILNSIGSSFEEAFVNDFAFQANARIIGKVPRSQVVRQCELYGKTVIESSPHSNQSYYYRRLANRIVDATETIYSGNLPQPMSAERLRAWSHKWADRMYALENGLVSDGAAI